MITGKDLAEKLYSEVEENNLLQEIYEKAFSEGYEYAQKEFARRDYLGLSINQAKVLRDNRRNLAKDLVNDRNIINSSILSRLKKKNFPKEEIDEARKDFYDLELDELKKRKKITKELVKNLVD